MTTITDEVRTATVVDVDSHILEPADLWMSRLPAHMHDVAPRVIWDDETGEERWVVGDVRLGAAAKLAMGGWREPYPFSPPSIIDAPKAAYDASARLEWMDEQGIAAQVLYPNLLGFDVHAMIALGPDVALACVRAYNDFLTEWCGTDPDRLVAITNVPFWDIDAAVVEMERCHEAGHKGLLMAAHYEKGGYPNIASPEWAPLLAGAEERGLSINFHIGFSRAAVDELEARYTRQGRAVFEQMDPAAMRQYVINAVQGPSVGFMSNAQAISDVICTGLCQRYPDLKFVSVESGFGYIPFLLQAMDWQWTNMGVQRVDPSLAELLPSEYFRRQIYATFWYEQPNRDDLIGFQDNVMFETDYPHPVSLTPGPYAAARSPRDTIVDHLGALPSDVLHKVLHDNAATLYRLPGLTA